MLGKVLIVDQIAINRIALRAKLGAAQFDVTQSATIEDAVAETLHFAPDLIVTAPDLPDGSALDLIANLDRCLRGPRPPLVVLAQPLEEKQRLALLAGGVDDIVEKPFDAQLFLARLRGHVRMANAQYEWHLREDTTRALGCAEEAMSFAHASKVHVIAETATAASEFVDRLQPHLQGARFSFASSQDILPDETSSSPTDTFVLRLGQTQMPDMLRLLSGLRCHKGSRHAAIFVVQDQPEPELGAYALDMGASDVIDETVNLPEIALRLRALLRRKHIGDRLRDTVQTGLEAAVCDPLTGLYNRRYALPHLSRMLERSTQTRKPVAVMIADMDHFKRINDTHGHKAGDAVLVETASRLRHNLRSVDMISRIGGEEFLIALPGVSLDNACRAAERLCNRIHEAPYVLPNSNTSLMASISIGLTVFEPDANAPASVRQPTPQVLIDQADQALYSAKAKGRNRFRLSKPAA